MNSIRALFTEAGNRFQREAISLRESAVEDFKAERHAESEAKRLRAAACDDWAEFHYRMVNYLPPDDEAPVSPSPWQPTTPIVVAAA